MKRIVWLLLLLLTVPVILPAQPFADEIAVFKKKDSVSFPQKGAILFVGSSSFRKWTDVQNYFPASPVINRGFGGSTLPDVIRYAGEIIVPYQPKQIVIYCGENDIAYADSVTGKMVCNRFKQLFSLIRANLPDVPLVFVSIKPSPSRWQMRDRMQDANRRIRKFLVKQSNTRFVSVWKAMLDENGLPRAEIFEADKLHMNAKGYAIWQQLLEPVLL